MFTIRKKFWIAAGMHPSGRVPSASARLPETESSGNVSSEKAKCIKLREYSVIAHLESYAGSTSRLKLNRSTNEAELPS